MGHTDKHPNMQRGMAWNWNWNYRHSTSTYPPYPRRHVPLAETHGDGMIACRRSSFSTTKCSYVGGRVSAGKNMDNCVPVGPTHVLHCRFGPLWILRTTSQVAYSPGTHRLHDGDTIRIAAYSFGSGVCEGASTRQVSYRIGNGSKEVSQKERHSLHSMALHSELSISSFLQCSLQAH